jgi:hypothetical protein
MEYLEQPTLLEIYQDRLELITCCVTNEVCEFLEYCADIKAALNYDPSPRPPQEFDPLKTVGKYE